MVSTTWSGLPSAVDLGGIIALTNLSLARYDQFTTGQAIAQGPPTTDLEASARQNSPSLASKPVPPAATPQPTATAPPSATSQPTATQRPAPKEPTASKAKRPEHVDERLGPAWSELMENSATAKSGEKLRDLLRKIVEKTDVKISVGTLPPNVGGLLQSVARINGDKATVEDSEITVNRDVMNESPRVLAAIVAHEIVHANQPVMRSNGERTDCVEAEVEAYAVQAQVWGAFWGQEFRPGQSKWERSMNYVEEAWKDGGEQGLRSLVRDETDSNSHSCFE
jgi:type IV secretory pathway VirB10-like protein